MLDNLHQVLALLQTNQDNLDRSLQLLAPFYRVFTNALGNGKWFDNYICNLSAAGIAGSLGLGLGNVNSGCAP
jgi:phospholipid/cholesterol/gamma-HCH transport system substrate-binding protein